MTRVQAAPLAILGLLAACGSGDTGATSPAAGAATAQPTATTAQLPFADCSAVHFGPALAPKDAPANVHVYSTSPALQIDQSKLYLATITTPRGIITLCLQPQLAPRTVNNFVVLARNHYFDQLTFHRVVPGFIIQGGDPKGDGTGGPGYSFDDELPPRQQYVDGAVAMANRGADNPNTNGSQFFIDTADDTKVLQPLYNLFGHVQTGLTVAKQVQAGDVMRSVTVSEQQ